MGEKYYQSAKKFGETLLNEGFGEELRAQYQHWVNQMKNAIGLSEVSPTSSSSSSSTVRGGKKGGKKGKNKGRKSSSSSSSSSSPPSPMGHKRATIPSRPVVKSKSTREGLGLLEGNAVDGLKKKSKRISGLRLKHPKRSKQLPQVDSKEDGSKLGMKSGKGKAGGIGVARVDSDDDDEEQEEEEDVDYFPLDAMIFFGDLNYRLDVPRLEVAT